MIPKRDRVRIMHDMLEVVIHKGNKAKLTHILYKANLSHNMFTEYMGELMRRGFVAEDVDQKERKSYSLTEKGFNFMRDYKVIKDFLDSYGLI